MAWIIVAVVVALLVIWTIAIYNGLVRSRNQVDNAWSQIDVQLKRRVDLIPNLVETVKGYAAHEKQTLEAVIKDADPRQPIFTINRRRRKEADNRSTVA